MDGQAERPMSEYEQAAKPQPDEPSGPPLPRIGESTDLSFPDASGRTWSERDFRGKVCHHGPLVGKMRALCS